MIFLTKINQRQSTNYANIAMKKILTMKLVTLSHESTIHAIFHLWTAKILQELLIILINLA